MKKLTLFGRSVLLMGSLSLANAMCWIAAGILFGRKSETQPILSLALLAWTLGLRHALDADHISAIDNATRGLINTGQLPITCGLFFSLGHSTIVIAVNVAIAISTTIYNKLDGIGTIGGIVGSAVSGSFLFIVALANSIILYQILRRRRAASKRAEENYTPEVVEAHHDHMLMLRILGPIINFVNKPWKMYPVGILFGFGFDTASSIALLAVSALAVRRSDGTSVPRGYIVILPFLFTFAMALLDSADSVLMLYSYSGFPEHSWALFEPSVTESETVSGPPRLDDKAPEPDVAQLTRDQRVKMNVMSKLSIVLTIMSILVAFSISLITIMGLIGDQCTPCQRAANAPDGGGLAGKWWRGWANANDNSGYIGAAIVGGFVFLVAFWYLVRHLRLRGQVGTIQAEATNG
ncbi:unnamed protein product [Mycena citricolor]|uniref:Nickel/cobalt efflux system n=1 Tax=Mycena citricolor TaxID=2018698 RepID=A0AAD2H8Y3_9AGAR|nr:unnamed protein product [Mycena citricolor]CAK5270350.1 unnamed protein product [Mycena citricolor]